MIGNFLYISESKGGQIVKADVTQQTPVAETVLNGLAGPTMTAFNGLDLYYGEFTTSTVSKISVNQLEFATPQSACANDAGVVRGGGTPIGGVYSGSFVTDNGNGETFTFDAQAAGTGMHTVTYSLPGTGQSANSMIEVIADDDASFTYAATTYNTDDADPTPSITGLIGGTFSSTPGLSLNGASGTIDLSASTPGTYAVTYTTSGTCPNNSNVNITINAVIPTPGNECPDANDINNLFGQDVNVPQTSGIWDNTHYSTTGDPADGWECFGEPDGSGANPTLDRTIWYSFLGDGQTYRIRTVACNATNYADDTQMAIYSGDCNTPIPVACNDDEDGQNGVFNAYLEIETQAGEDYLIMIDGFGPDFAVIGEFCLEITLLESSSVSNLELTDIQIFPNPTSGIIQLPGHYEGQAKVFDNTGQLVSTKENPGNQMDLSNLPSGIYLIKISEDQQVFTARVVKE